MTSPLQNPDVKIWGIDTYGSVFKKYKETGIFDPNEIYPYITEGIGEDILPKNVDFDLIDAFEKVTDKDAAIMARRLAREEGILLGYSCGSAMQGLMQLSDKFTEKDVVVVIFHDHGSRYIGKIYNDDWMRERGFLDDEIKVKDIISRKNSKNFFHVTPETTVKAAFEMMKKLDISQMPVMSGTDMVGSISENSVLTYLLENPMKHTEHHIEDIMDAPFPIVNEELPVKQLNRYISKRIPAVIARDKAGSMHVLTKYDIIQAV